MARIMRFGAVGVASAAIYFLCLALLVRVSDQIFLITIVCYAVAMVFNYLAQSVFTFRQPERTYRSMRRFISMQIGAMMFNSTAMTVLVGSLLAPLYPAQVLVTSIVTVATFLISKKWVYTE